MTVEYDSDVSDEQRRSIAVRVREFNDSTNGFFQEARRPGGGRVPVGVIARTEGDVVGGATGHVIWNWLHIEDLWVSDDRRGRGIGTELVRRVEDLARLSGATRADLRTFGFQAREFYEKLGYRVVGALDGYPPDSSFFWLTRTL